VGLCSLESMHVEILGSGPRLVLVHGSVGFGLRAWEAQWPLADRYTLVVPTRSGYPPNPPLAAIDFEEQAAEVAGLLEDGDHLVGHSYGGVVALLAAAAGPPLRSLTVAEPPAFAVARGNDAVEAFLAVVLDAPPDPQGYLETFLPAVGSAVPIPDPLPEALEAGARAAIAERPPSEAEIPLVALRHRLVRKLVVSGAHHPAFDAVCDVLVRELDAERAVVPGAGHSIPRAPGFNDVLLSFLARAAIRFPIETERLLVRPFNANDTEALHAVWGDPAARRFGGGWPRPETLADTRRYLEPIMAGQAERGYATWAVVERETGRLIGDCGLFPADDVGPDVELAYGLAPDVWGRGYATEAAAACLRAGFEQLGLERVVADVDPSNPASVRVLEKIGMRPVGRKDETQLLYAAARA
jgi:RimJ/RimL family protein N-acetyltransferase/pimeloyl-ACP methyl ester carboxylesterase